MLNTDDASEINRLRKCGTRKEQEKLLADLFTRHRERLHSMVDLRLHQRLRGRISPSDVIQDVFLEASKKLERFLRKADVPFFLWLRRVTADKLHDLHRHHLGAQARDARLERALGAVSMEPEATSSALAAQLVWKGTTPSQAAMKVERRATLEAVLEKLDPLDREILALRYFEELTSAEAAKVLRIKEEAARKRYLRALKRLRAIMGDQWGPRKESE